MKEKLQEQIAKGQSYGEFRAMVTDLLSRNMTTGTNHSEAYINYTKMNETRMNRLDKTAKLRDDMQASLTRQIEPMTWLILVEAWCGDVAQNMPVIAKMADLAPGIEIKMILRDENLEIMDQFLTDGGRGVPKLIAVWNHSGEIAGTWGPRPEPAQEMVRAYKKLTEKPPYSEFVKGVQMWYNKDKNQTIQDEFMALIGAWEKSPATT